MNIPERHKMIDLLVRAVDGCVNSEGMIWGLSNREEEDILFDYIEEYLKEIDNEFHLYYFGEKARAEYEAIHKKNKHQLEHIALPKKKT